MSRFRRSLRHFPLKLTILIAILLLFQGKMSTAKKSKVTDPKKVPKNAILLSKVESLTFYSGRKTTGRRSSPVPQLTCTGPADVCALYAVDVMRCKNEGADYDAENIQWACKASLPDEFKLGGTEVVCEGYESADDPYILRGSCGVEYRLLLTDKGEETYGKGAKWSTKDDYGLGASSKGKGFGSAVFFFIFAAVLFLIIRGFLRSWRQSPNRRVARPRGYGGGGGGNNDDHPPPPPYDSHGFDYGNSPPRKPRTTQSSSSSTANSSRSAGGQQQDGAWRPGFWTGAAAGGAAAYLASQRRNQTQQQTREETRAGGLFGGGSSRSSSATSSSWNAPASGSGSRSSNSDTRHESTGFGGTRRR